MMLASLEMSRPFLRFAFSCAVSCRSETPPPHSQQSVTELSVQSSGRPAATASVSESAVWHDLVVVFTC